MSTLSDFRTGHHKCGRCGYALPKMPQGRLVPDTCAPCKASELRDCTIYDRDKHIGSLPPNLRDYTA
jgi:hypothetical protein